jgi:hypothetical protein
MKENYHVSTPSTSLRSIILSGFEFLLGARERRDVNFNFTFVYCPSLSLDTIFETLTNFTSTPSGRLGVKPHSASYSDGGITKLHAARG